MRRSISNVHALTWSSYTAMFFLGFGITLVGAAARNIGLEPHQIGLLVSAQHLGFAISVVTTGLLADVLPKPRLLAIGSVVLGVSFLLVFRSEVFAVNLALMLLNGMGIGVYEGVTDAWLIDLHRDRHSRYINVNHFFATIGSAGITLYLIFLQLGWRTSVVEAGIVVLVLALFFLFAHGARGTRADAGSTFKRLSTIPQKPLLATLFVVAVMAVGIELGTMGYLTSFMMETRGWGQTGSKIGLVLFLAGIASGRVVIGFAVRDDHIVRTLIALFALTAAVFVILLFGRLGWAIHLVVFFAGFALSSTFPMVISLVAKIAPDAAGATIGLTKLAVPLGGILLSFVISMLSRELPLNLALLAVPAAAMVGFVTIGAIGIWLRKSGGLTGRDH